MIAALLTAFLLFQEPAPTLETVAARSLVDKAQAAAVLLYSQTDDGSLRMHCTATAFEKTAKGYLFVTAAHCVGEDRQSKERSADPTKAEYYVTFDPKGTKAFYPAHPVFVGYQSNGDDFAVFEVETTEHWQTIPLGDEKKEKDGSAIINVASPLGLGKQVFHGYISKLEIDRPLVEGSINWKGAMFLSIDAGPGSSGSSVIAVDQRAIVGFLVGTVGGKNVVAIPVSRFVTVRAKIAKGGYPYWEPKE